MTCGPRRSLIHHRRRGDGKGETTASGGEERYDAAMGSDIEVLDLKKRRGSYHAPPPAPIIDPAIAVLVHTVRRFRRLELPPLPYGPGETEHAVTELVTRTDRDTLRQLLDHPSRTLRCRLAMGILDLRRAETEALYPLLADDRPIDVSRGCYGGWERVGSYVARDLGEFAHGDRRWGRDEKIWGTRGTDAECEVARGMLLRAVRDAALPVTVRGAAVQALVYAVGAAAEPVVREFLASPEPNLLYAALSGLEHLPATERWAVLRALGDHPLGAIRARALEVGAELASPDLTEACERVLRDDPDAMLRRLALLNLPHPSPLSIEVVRAAVGDADRYVAEAALRWLIEEDAEAAALLVCEGITRPDEHIEMGNMGRLALRRAGPTAEVVARHAVALDGALAAERRDLIGEALDCVGERHLLDCLGHVRRHLASPDAYVADRAACAAGRLGDHASIERMEALLVAKEWRAREGAAEGLAALGSVRSLPLLRAALEGVVPVTRQVIEAAIAQLEATGEPPAQGVGSLRVTSRSAFRRPV